MNNTPQIIYLIVMKISN